MSYHPGKFGCHGHSDSGDVMVFICHLTLQDHVVKVFYHFMFRSLNQGKSTSYQVWWS